MASCNRADFHVSVTLRSCPQLIWTMHLARFHHQLIWQKGKTSNQITKGDYSTLFFFFLWLNPYLHCSPSGLLAPAATARFFFWLGHLGNSLLEFNWNIANIGLWYFLSVSLIFKTPDSQELEHIFRGMAQLNRKQAFRCDSMKVCSERENSVNKELDLVLMLHLAFSDSLRSFHMTNLFTGVLSKYKEHSAHVTIRRNNQHPSISSWNTDGRTHLARVLHRPELSAPVHICLVHSGLQSGANAPHYIFKTNSSQHPFYPQLITVLKGRLVMVLK